MSKTYKTRPYWVKINEPRHLVDEHDHRGDLPCDLPETPIFYLCTEAPKTRCYWEETTDARVAPQNRCGCPMCTMKHERRADRRRDRRKARDYVNGKWAGEY